MNTFKRVHLERQGFYFENVKDFETFLPSPSGCCSGWVHTREEGWGALLSPMRCFARKESVFFYVLAKNLIDDLISFLPNMSAAEDAQSPEQLNKFEKLSGSPPLRVAGQCRANNNTKQK